MVYKSRSNTPFVPGPVVSDAAPDSFLEYAETQQINGSPYLNTGIVAKRGTKFEYVGTWCKTTCQSAAGSTVLGGVSGSTSSTEFDYWLGRNANSWMSASKNCNTDIAFPPDANEVFTIISEFLPNTASADSNFRFIAQSDSHSADMTVAGPNYDTELSMFLFCANGENGRSRDADGKCQSVRIWQVPTGGSEYVLVREFRPCVADGEVGFYDKVSQKVFRIYAAWAAGEKTRLHAHRQINHRGNGQDVRCPSMRAARRAAPTISPPRWRRSQSTTPAAPQCSAGVFVSSNTDTRKYGIICGVRARSLGRKERTRTWQHQA